MHSQASDPGGIIDKVVVVLQYNFLLHAMLRWFCADLALKIINQIISDRIELNLLIIDINKFDFLMLLQIFINFKYQSTTNYILLCILYPPACAFCTSSGPLSGWSCRRSLILAFCSRCAPGVLRQITE